LRYEARSIIVYSVRPRVSKRGAARPIIVRALRADDLDALFGARERALGEEWLAGHECGEIYVAVAEVGGVPVGRRCLDLTSHADEGVPFAFAAAVRPDWRSRGIGSMLDAHLAEVALARGFRVLRCTVAKHNTRAIAWHDRLGYRCIGEGIHSWIDPEGHEVVVDCWELERPLGSFPEAADPER
jgi:GNAT superfamily N-acetyltransferase